jgi:predicted ribosome quality control (RQC) complex YloA/Tae2 family protein
MVTHYFTLAALSAELDDSFRSLAVTDIFTQQKNEIVLHAEPGDRSLHISVDPRMNFLFMEEGSSRARRNSVDLFGELTGSAIRSVAIQPYDRTVRLDVEDGRHLFLQLYNSAASNVYLTDAKMVVLNSFKNRKKFEGTLFESGERPFDPALLDDPALFRLALTGVQAAEPEHNPNRPNRPNLASLFGALKETVPVLGSTFAREALYRAGIGEDTALTALGDAAGRLLFDAVRGIFASSLHPGAYLYFRGNRPAVLSTMPIGHLADAEVERVDDVNRAVRIFIGRAFRSRTFESDKQALISGLRKELERSRRSLEAGRSRASGSSRAEEYERVGRLIIENIYRIGKGTSRIELSGHDEGAETTRVTLDPALTPARNAEAYFEKAKKARAAAAEGEARLGALGRRVTQAERMLLLVEQCATQDELTTFRTENTLMLKGVDTGGEPEEEKLPFRIFEVAGGFQVLVGKSSTNNDLLTTRYAKPNDLWFHTRGASGSHTVLKVGKGQQVPREAIRAAAGIAAYYSKMRKGSNVPVAYCERKYVRKPKGAPPGTVTLEREEIIFVKPHLP